MIVITDNFNLITDKTGMSSPFVNFRKHTLYTLSLNMDELNGTEQSFGVSSVHFTMWETSVSQD